MKAGKPTLPEFKPKAESAPAKETPAKVVETEGKTAPASEPGKESQEPKRNTAEARLNELLDDLRAAGLTPKQLKTFESDYQRKEAKTEPAKAAPEQTAKPVDPKAPIKPKASDFEGKPWEEYEAARDEYFEKLADYKASQAIEARDARQKQENVTKELTDRVEALSKQYGAEAKGTIQEASKQLFDDAKVNGVVKELVNSSPLLVDVLYTLGGDKAGMDDFLADAKNNPGAAIRKFVLLEKLVQEELTKGSAEKPTERGEDGKFKAPEKKTAAPAPPKELGGNRSAVPDEVENATQTALDGGDSRAAIDAMTRKRIQRLKGR